MGRRLLLFLLLWGIPVWAQSGMPHLKTANLVGFVYTRATSQQNSATSGFGFEGLEGVEVVVEGVQPALTTTTNDKGYFQFEDVPPGAYRLRCSKAGYNPGTVPVRVSKDGMISPTSVAMLPLGSVNVGEMVVGPGTVYVAYAGDPAKDDGSDLRQRWQVRILELLENHDLPKGMPRPADCPTCLDFNFIMAWNRQAPSQAEYTLPDNKPLWLAFAGAHELYVSYFRVSMLSVYGGPQGDTLLANLPFNGAITDLLATPDRRWVLAAIMGKPCQVLVIDSSTRQVARTLPCPDPPAVLAGGLDSLYAAFPGYVAKLDPATGSILARGPVGNAPSALALSPDGRYLYCVNSGSANLSVLETATLKEVGRTAVGITPIKVVVSPDGSRIFVSNRGSHSVSVLEGPLASKVLTTVKMPKGPQGMAMARDGSQVYVACKDAGCLAVLDGRSGQVLQLTPQQPRSAPWGVVVRP